MGAEPVGSEYKLPTETPTKIVTTCESHKQKGKKLLPQKVAKNKNCTLIAVGSDWKNILSAVSLSVRMCQRKYKIIDTDTSFQMKFYFGNTR